MKAIIFLAVMALVSCASPVIHTGDEEQTEEQENDEGAGQGDAEEPDDGAITIGW